MSEAKRNWYLLLADIDKWTRPLNNGWLGQEGKKFYCMDGIFKILGCGAMLIFYRKGGSKSPRIEKDHMKVVLK